MVNRRRLLWAVPLLLVIAAVAYSAWLAWQVQGSLTRAEDDANLLRSALDDRDPGSRDKAVAQLRDHARDAAGHTDGAWWGALTHLPVIGDDATGVRALSRSLDTIAVGGVEPLAASMDELDSVTAGGRIDVESVRDLQDPVSRATDAFLTADHDVASLDSSGYAGPLKSRFDRYAELIHDAARSLDSAQTAAEVLPTMVGADGSRNYLLVFQNNAEIRATGGLAGAWARIHADNGKLTIVEQGAGSDFGRRAAPVLPLSPGEREVYGAELGTYFVNAGLTPDFPRAAKLMSVRWEERYPATKLDGVVALDPVAMSYLLEGTGPVKLGSTTLTSDTVVDQLLSEPYKTLDPKAQDALFQQAARAIFEAATGDLPSPLKFVEGLARSASEGRFLVAAFDPEVEGTLAGTRVEGALAGDDGSVPHVDVAVNDATMSKLSYYLRYWAEVKPTTCDGGVQALSGSMTINQRISPAEAAKLPESVTGPGGYGFKRGLQLLLIRLYGPYDGSIDHVTLNGKALGKHPQVTELDGREVTTIFLQLNSRKDMVINWTMHTGEGQTGDVKLGMTPSIVPGNNDSVARSAC